MKRSLRASREVRFCQVPARLQKKGARLRGTERLFVCLWGPTLSPACRASLPPFPLSFRPPEELTKAPELSDQDTHYFLTSMSMRKFTGSFFCLYWEDKGHTLSFCLPLPNDSWCLLHPWIPPPSQVTPPRPNSAVLGHLSRDWLSSPQPWRLCSFCKSFCNNNNKKKHWTRLVVFQI